MGRDLKKVVREIKAKSCEEFIIKVVREIREKPSNIKSGVSSGISLQRIYNFSNDRYSKEEFIDALNSLINLERVMIISSVWDNDGPVKREDKSLNKKLTFIPSTAPIAKMVWNLDENGEEVSDKSQKCRVFFDPHLYIIDDGLPKKVQRFLKKKEIMADCQENNPS